MKKNLLYITIALCIALSLIQCAKRGSPTGGPVDEEPPVILRIFPDNYTRNFKKQIIEIEFDEFVKLNDLQKQLVISPPLKSRPIISPQGSPSKKITIEITDTLQDNTTYVLNFGESIVDNNESNPYPFFKYVFSTGEVIDSLTLKGKVTDALNYETDDFISVMLYEVDEEYTDSIIYKEAPRYVLNTLDSLTTFTMENLKEGTYRIVALKEENSDLRFDPKRDKIGFVSEEIVVPTDQQYEIRMYQQEADSEIKKITQQAASRLYVTYTGNVDNLQVKPLDASIIENSRITKLEKKDTLQYWYRPTLKEDSVLMIAQLDDKEPKEFNVRLKEMEKDSLTIKKETTFSLRNPASISASTPFEFIDNELIDLTRKDSTAVAFETVLDSLNNKAIFNFEREEDQLYKMTLFPGAITDFYGSKNTDTLNYSYGTKKTNALGNISVKLNGGNSFPIIIQVTKKDLSVIAEQSVKANNTYDFFYLDPGEYYLRIIYDTNANGKYDAGNFLENIQPEVVQYYPEIVKLQANWDRNYTFNL
ncbi:Ig-like domain-containing protein [Nonlabens dokdonensis]|nr:Ig-like domain-containing protein [Nonlabens dokdonensis]